MKTQFYFLADLLLIYYLDLSNQIKFFSDASPCSGSTSTSDTAANASDDSSDDALDYDFDDAIDDAFDDAYADALDNPLDNPLDDLSDDTSADASDDSMENLVPVTKIPNTSLFTGLFYKPVFKTKPKGLMTWVEEGKYYIILEQIPEELSKFETGKKRQYDHVWTFGATETNVSYTMTNRGKPLGHLLWVSAKVGVGKHVAIYDSDSARKKMSEGGEWRKDASWMVNPTDEENYFKIENAGKRSNYLTWTEAKYKANDPWVELAKDFHEDSKMFFKPMYVKLNGLVFDFKFSKSLDTFISANESDYSMEHKKNISNTGNTPMMHTLESEITTEDSITISFKNSLPALSKMTFSINFGPAKIKYSTAAPFNSNEEFHIEVPKMTPFKQQITIPPMKMIEAGIFSSWAKNIDLSFTAALKLTGTAERMVVGHPDQIGEGPVPSAVVKQKIKSSKLANLLLSGSDVIVGISGELKGKIGMNLILGLKTHGKFAGLIQICR